MWQSSGVRQTSTGTATATAQCAVQARVLWVHETDWIKAPKADLCEFCIS